MSCSLDCDNNLTQVPSDSCSYRVASSSDSISTTMGLEDGNEDVEIVDKDKVGEVDRGNQVEVEIITDTTMAKVERAEGNDD